MVKESDRTHGKRLPARSDEQPTGPMTLGNMRSLGPRDLDVTCKACGYHTTVNVDTWPDDIGVPSFGPRMRCTRYCHLRASVRPDWTQLRAAPKP
jgi:hypothetical protein